MSKYLGQHFLVNKEKLKKITEALELRDGDLVIEIGAGHGELTRLIAKKFEIRNSKFEIVAIEKDPRLTKYLQKRFSEDKNIKFIEGDALKIIPNLIKTQNLKPITYKIVGNIPYYITGRLLRILGEIKNKPKLIVLTVQKEVAKRICAKPPRMNLLAASVQFWAKPEIIGYISKKDFRPIPKVDSAIIKILSIAFKQRSLGKCYREGGYYKFIKILFKQPRKTIINNLIEGLKIPKEEIIEKLKLLKINPSDRPQNLSISQLTDIIHVLR